MSATPTKTWNARSLLLLALAVTLVASLIPFGEFVIYPFRLFGTFIHETAHALAAVLTGGDVLGMHVNWNTSGETLTRGGSRFLISSAGYLGSIVAGAALLLAGRRQKWARPTLLTVGTLTILATAAFAGYGSILVPLVGLGLAAGLVFMGRRWAAANTKASKSRFGSKETHATIAAAVLVLAVLAYLGVVGGLLTWAIGLLVGGGLLALGAWGSRTMAHGAVLFLAVQTSLDALNALKTLLSISMVSRGHSDAANLAEMTGIPATAWATIWGLAGLAMIAAAMWVFWRDEKKQVKA